MQDGDYRMVVMNADGGPEFISTLRLGVTVPNAFPISLAVLAGSVIVTGCGVLILVFGMSRRRRQGR